MKRYINGIILCLISAALTVSCFNDKGNYDYKELVPIEIDPASVPEAVVKSQLEYLVITPVVKQGDGDANLEYEWRLKDNLWAPDPATGKFINEVIGRSKDLNYLLDVPARSYHLLLYVTDKTNGVTQYRHVDLAVQTIAPQGLIVLNGDDVSCDVSIVVNEKINASIAGFTDDKVTHNAFSDNNGRQKAEGAPLFIWNGYGGSGGYAYIFTNSAAGGYRVTSADLKITGDYRSNFHNLPANNVGFEGFGTWSYNELLVNNGDVYYCAQTGQIVQIPFGVKCFGLDYKAAPYIGTNQNGYLYGAFYDTKHKRFLYINYQQTVMPFHPPANGYFSLNNIDKEMVYGEMGFPLNTWFCLMQDDGDSATRKLYILDLTKSPNVNPSPIGSKIIDIGMAAGMADSEYFAFGMRGNVMYHATDTKLYYNNFNGDQASSLIYDVAANYPGYEITCLQMYKYTSNATYHSKLLFTGIYNPTTQQGILLQFTVNETNGSLEEATPTVYAGFERIASVSYKWK